MRLEDFDFDLPPFLIARYPTEKRRASRLLCLNEQGTGGAGLMDRFFYEIGEWIRPGDLVVLNDTKVIPARLIGQKITGGRVEVLVERILGQQLLLAQLYASNRPKIGDVLIFAEHIQFKVLEQQGIFYLLQYQPLPHTSDQSKSIGEVLNKIGQIPLPPYLRRLPEEQDKERYQTVYARYAGSVAAPTAGLHFDSALLQQLRDQGAHIGYLTLHIGAGTFAPIRAASLSEHKMHKEYYAISTELCQQIQTAKMMGQRVIAIGTTTLRALESMSQKGVIQETVGETDLFIYPGYSFHCVDVLVTNFHLPRSTLLLLVAAFGGYPVVMQAYRHALAGGYRFYSYGDAMWISKCKSPSSKTV